MLGGLGLKLEGRHHSGIGIYELSVYNYIDLVVVYTFSNVLDDSKNIARILVKILERGVDLRETMTLPVS
jgi:hypothetical protein